MLDRGRVLLQVHRWQRAPDPRAPWDRRQAAEQGRVIRGLVQLERVRLELALARQAVQLELARQAVQLERPSLAERAQELAQVAPALVLAEPA